MIGHRWGCQVPNGPGWSAGDIADVYGDGVFVLMQGDLNQLEEMHRLMPNAWFIWRAYLESWFATSAIAHAAWCAEIYRSIKHITRKMTWANEQNLRAESGGLVGADAGHLATRADYERIRDWNLTFINSFLSQPGCEDVEFVFPALAYGHSDDQDDGDGFIGLEILRPVIELCTFGSIHLYVNAGHVVNDPWNGIGRLARQRPWFLGKPLLITETGCFEAGSPEYPAKIVSIGYALQSEPDVCGFCFFIHADPTKHHQQNDMSRNPQPYQAIKDATKTARPDPASVHPSEPPKEDSVPVPVPTADWIDLEPGRGLWVWYRGNSGGIGGLIEKCQQARCKYVLLKVADGDHAFDFVTRMDVANLQAAGFKVLAWHYIYGNAGDAETSIASGLIEVLRPDGWVADVEAEYESSPSPALTGERYASAISTLCHDIGVPFGYSPVPVIDFHQRLPFVQFNAHSDFVMPQFYRRMLGMPPWTFEALWEQWSRWSLAWSESGLRVPKILPVGEAYRDNQSGSIIPDADIHEYEAFCKSIGCEVPTYWVADFAQPSHLDAMANEGGPDVTEPVAVPDEDQRINDEVWQHCEALEALAVRARLIGLPWRAHGLDGAALSAKAATKVNV